MRLLYASERPPYPFFLGGAARCTHEILHKLTNIRLVDSIAIGSASFSKSSWNFPEPSDYDILGIRKVEKQSFAGEIDCGYPIHVIEDFFNDVEKFIDDFRPDVIWTQMEGSRFVIETARRKKINNLLFIHDAEFDPVELKDVSKNVNGIVSSSRFLANKVRKVTGMYSQVVYPCPKIDFDVNGDENGYVTMINPHRVKGFDTFLQIAKRMPMVKFLLVESWQLSPEYIESLHEKIDQLPNVKFIRRVSDMRIVYQTTKVLLAPSIWEEGFGMVTVEAQSCGIPVIASARGGLPESVGHGGILISDYKNPGAWVREIKRLAFDKTYYSKLSKRAFEHAHHESLSTTKSAYAFYEFCQELLSRKVTSRGKKTFMESLKDLIGDIRT